MLPPQFWADLTALSNLDSSRRPLIIALLSFYTTNYTGVSFLRIEAQLNRMEAQLTTQGSAISRLQTDATNEANMLTQIQAAIAALAPAQAAAVTRLEADIAALQNLSGSGDADAINAVAASMETTLTGFQAVSDQLTAAAATAAATDQLTISPATVTVVRGSTQQFSASMPSTFKAVNGSVDTTGLYTPPTDLGIVSDTVTATSTDGTQTASASVSISDPPPAVAQAVKPV